VYYCLDGMKKFREMGDTKMKSLVYEIEVLGRNRIDINDPAKKHPLKSLTGNFSELHLVSLMYTGFRMIAPTMDTGIALSLQANFQYAREPVNRIKSRQFGGSLTPPPSGSSRSILRLCA
jgi:hypothetical protein